MTFESGTSKRTLVEFYDSEYLENIVSLLYWDYSEVVFVYFTQAGMPTEREQNTLKEYIRNNFGITPRFVEIKENTIECALKSFRTMVSDGKAYDFDITGGSSVFVAAAGALVASDESDRLFLHECNPASGKCITAYPKHSMTAKRSSTVQLTVDHILALRGIEVLHLGHPIRYRLDCDDLRGEVFRLWDAIRDELKAWNTLSVVRGEIKQRHDGIFVNKWMNYDQKKACKELLMKLEKKRIISGFYESGVGSEIEISYRLNVPGSALFLYDKGGNILEMLTYVTAVDSGCFADCCTGVSLDWDDSDRYGAADPYNEIDTVLTRGHIPYFISCKNTEVRNDFLYEIMVMARHYGGKYAVPVMLCTTPCKNHLHVRAKEMGIVLIDDVARLNEKEFSERLIYALTSGD